jgi:hypothetical protein
MTLCPWAKKKAILDCARLFAGRKSTARSFSLFIPAWYGCGVWFCSRGIKRAQDDSVFFGALEWWLWLGVVAE